MKRVLVVEDQADGAYMLRVLLEGHGFTVDVARHGAEALSIARQHRPDVVVSDLFMPVMDGYTLLRRWKRDDRLKQVPFVVYTATYTDPADERLAIDLGADAFIVKPAEPDVLLARLQTVLAEVDTLECAAPSEISDSLVDNYSRALIRKLEKRTAELERVNGELLQERLELMLRDRVIRAVSQGIVIADATHPDLPVIYASPSFERLTGYANDEILGNNCRFLQGPDTDATTVAEIREALTANRECAVEILNYRKDGTPFWNALTISPVRDDQGRVSHFVGLQTDVTERRSLEAQLLQAQKMEAVGQLAAGVAHDFNNLLSVILSYTTFAIEALGPGEVREDLEEVRAAGQRAAELTRQLLAFSRQQVLAPRVIDLDDVVKGMEGLLRRLVGEVTALELIPGTRGARIFADPAQLEQVVMNLVVNARDAMPEGGKLTIETEPITIDEDYAAHHHGMAPGDYVMLAITDTGVGMDQQTRERIFEPFFTTKTEGRGTGLGLSTVFGIVSQSQGHVFAYSELGHGSTFRVFLPRSDAAGERPERGHAPSSRGGTERVLVVEDEPTVRAIACTILRRHGYEVTEAADGKQALAVARGLGKSIDLLLTDVIMPHMSGAELAKTLLAERPGLRVVYMSGYTKNAIVQQRVVEGAAHFLQKPITPTRLLDVVRHALDDADEP